MTYITEARLGVAELGVTPLGYFVAFPFVTIGGVDKTTAVQPGSLQLHEVINDEPDEAEFLIPASTGYVPTEGQPVTIAIGSVDNVKFSGYIVAADHKFESDGESTPWISVRCVDSMRRFNSRLVTHDFSGYTVPEAVVYLVENFTTGFTTNHVDLSIATVLDEYEAINKDPMTVLREFANLSGQGSGCKIVDRDVWFWGPGGLSGDFTPTQPDTLVGGLWSLHDFRHRQDTTQWRTKVICEGTSEPRVQVRIPAGADLASMGLPQDLAIGVFSPTGVAGANFARIGTMILSYAFTLQYHEPDYVVLAADANPGDTSIDVQDYVNLDLAVHEPGWFTPDWANFFWAGNFNSMTPPFQLTDIPASGYGALTVPIQSGKPCTRAHRLKGVTILAPPSGVVEADIDKGATIVIRAEDEQPAAQAVIAALEGGDSDGVYEHFISDSEATYVGCLTKARAELGLFSATLPFATWESSDMNATAGVPIGVNIALTGGLVDTLMIQKVTVVFPNPVYKGSIEDKVAAARPRRFCEGGLVKLAGVLG